MSLLYHRNDTEYSKIMGSKSPMSTILSYLANVTFQERRRVSFIGKRVVKCDGVRKVEARNN